MAQGKEIYRGYTITDRPINVAHSLATRQYMIYRDGEFVCQQPSREFAHHWIDGYIGERA